TRPTLPPRLPESGKKAFVERASRRRPRCRRRLLGFMAVLARYWLVQVLAKQQRPRRVAELGQGLRLDLPDPLAGHTELPADLFQRPRMPVGQPEAQLDDPLLPLRQLAEHPVELVLQHDERCRLDRHDGVRVLDEVTEVGLLLADRGLER